jgi:hypothetical protein
MAAGSLIDFVGGASSGFLSEKCSCFSFSRIACHPCPRLTNCNVNCSLAFPSALEVSQVNRLAELTFEATWLHFTGSTCVLSELSMPIRPFLQDDHSFGPEDIAKMSAAFEAALRELGLVDRNDPSDGSRQVDYRICESGPTRCRAAVRLTLQELSR